jgi:hypothetical protein
MKWIHIVAGLVSLVAGFMALYSTKGAPLHRRAGMAFAVAMMVMTSSALLMAVFMAPNRGNQVAATLTFYLVATSLLTVRRTVAQSRHLLAGFMVVAAGVGLYGMALGFEALGNANGAVDKIPAPPLFMFGVVALLGAALDARMLLAGHIEGKHRLARHLWRMTYALWIATTSAFLGQARQIPEEYRDFRLLAIPVLLVTIALVYWLVRVLRGRRLPAPRAARIPRLEDRPLQGNF